MKVLFAIKGLHQAAGGAERVICDVCSHLADHRKYDVLLLTFDSPGAVPFYPLSPGVKLIQLGVGGTNEPTSLLLLVRRMIALRRVVRELEPDVVVAFMHSMFIPMAYALAGSGIPVVASEHIVMDYYQTRRAEFALFIAAVPLICRITVLSDLVARHYPYWIRRKMIAVTNPISPGFLCAASSPASSDPHRILSIGRFSKRKDHITLLRAFAMLADEYPEWTLRILGDGALRPELEKEVDRLHLQHRAFLPGVVSNVAAEMADASFFALASQYESFGLVFAEAMACGKAAVAFATCQGANEIIDHNKTGLLVEGTDRITAMADGLRRLMVNSEERVRMGALAKERVFERFSIELVCSRWEQVLGEAVSLDGERASIHSGPVE